MSTLGQRIKLARAAAGLNQHSLAVKSGVAYSMISRIESEHVYPGYVTLIKLQGALGVSMDWLCGTDDEIHIGTREVERACAVLNMLSHWDKP